MSFAPEHGVLDVLDPYYGGGRGFEQVLDLIEAARHLAPLDISACVS